MKPHALLSTVAMSCLAVACLLSWLGMKNDAASALMWGLGVALAAGYFWHTREKEG